MLDLVGAWLVFPLLLAVTCLGLGLLVERLAGARVPGVLVLPLGFAGLIALSQTVTLSDLLAEAVTVIAGGAALAGLWLGRRRLSRGGVEGWPAAACGVVFAVFAAPIVLSGEATFAGYTLLGDTSIHLILSDWIGEHGLNRSGELADSSYAVALNTYIDTGYPTGTHAALAAARPFGFQDVAWLFQPFLAVAAAMAALAVYGLLERAIRPRPLRALAAALAAMPGLVYGYYLQGSVKEVAMVALLPLLAALAVWLWSARRGWRRTIPVAVAAAAAFGALNLAAAPYVGPLGLAAAAGLALRRHVEPRARALQVAALGALTALLSLPTWTSLGSFVDSAGTTLTSGEEMGNLVRPLSTLQAFGVWPRGDYRLALADHAGAGYVLIGVVAALAVFGVMLMLRRRQAGPLLLAATLLVATAYVVGRGSPWADGKALMIVSSGVVAAAMLGVESLRRSGHRVEAVVVAAAVAAGILWTNALAYRWADLAPRDRLEQLSEIGDAVAGQGPALYPEFEEFAKYFLRGAAPTGSSESWQVPPFGRLASGDPSPFALSTELDQLDPEYVRRFDTLVLRRGPAVVRAPLPYRRTMTTADYEVWQRPAEPDLEVVEHLGVGNPLTGRDPVECDPLSRVAGAARSAEGELAVLAAPPAVALPIAQLELPGGWTVDGHDPLVVRPDGAGTISGLLDIPATARYDVWLQGSFGRAVTVRAGGRHVGVTSERLSPRGGYERVGSVELGAGDRLIEISRPGGHLGPGGSGGNRLIGPVVLVAQAPEPRLVRVPPSRSKSICGQNADWVEAVRERR